jgi:hypothetical protein
MKRDRIYGIMAEFDSATRLIDAAKRTREAGYKKIDAYSPFPIEGLAEEIGFHHDEVPLVVLIGGIIGGLTGYLMQYWMSAVRLPAEHRRQAVSFLAIVHYHHVRDDDSVRRNLGGVRHAGAERPAHALSSGFQRAAFRAGQSKDRFFLIVFSSDPKYDPDGNAPVPGRSHPRSISEVPS